MKRTLLVGLYACIMLMGFGTVRPAHALVLMNEKSAERDVTDIRINEVSHGEVDYMGARNWVELYNAGDSETDVSTLFLCDFPNYPRINELTVLSGSTTIPAGGYLVLSWTVLDADSEIGLYQADASGDFDNASKMIDYMQYAFADHGREDTAVEAGLWTAGEFVPLADSSESLQFSDKGRMGAGNWSSAPATPGAENATPPVGVTDIRINEVSHGEVEFMGSTNWVELYNAGDSEIDVSELFLCDFPQYPRINELTILSGSIAIPAGGYLVLSWPALDDDAEVGLYQADAGGDFGNADKMINYMQYAIAGHRREEVAVEVGVWTADEFVPLANTGESLQYFDRGRVGASNWASAPATPGAENEEPGRLITDIRVNEVSHGEVDFMGSTRWVELYNTGDSETDVSELFLCDFPNYPRINDLTVLSGNTTIPAGGYLVLAWTVLDADSEVGLYQANAARDFNNPDKMIDYMQYAFADHGREDTAVEAGLWTRGEFVPLANSGESLQFFANDMVGAGNWASSAATPGAENESVSTSTDGFNGLPEEFRLYGNYPNPFNPTTTISYDLSVAGPVTLKIYSVLGREVATLVDGALPAGSYESAWDGRDSQGEVVSSGTYLYRLSYGNGESLSRVMVVVK